MSFEQRFWSKVRKGDGCWIWIAATCGKSGYGQIWYNGRLEMAHRVAYQILKGIIPLGYQIDHLCRTRLCVNPDHLEAVTRQENVFRGASPSAVVARTGVCSKGHTQFKDDGRCAMCYREWRIENQNKNRERRKRYMAEWRELRADHIREYKRRRKGVSQ